MSGFDLLGGSGIKSVQTLETIVTGPINQNFNISPVDHQKSIILVQTVGGNAQLRFQFFTTEFVNNETIRLIRGDSLATTDFLVVLTIIEFEQVKSKQVGDVSYGSVNMDYREIPISPIDINRSIVTVSCRTTSTSSYDPTSKLISKLLNNQTIGVKQGLVSVTYHYEVIEF